MKGIGLCGAHRVGKTTLARAAAKNFGLEFVPSEVSKVLKSLDFDPKGVWGASKRMEAQGAILVHHVDLWQKLVESGDRWITDRSPVDFIAYMLNDAVTWDDSAYELFCGYVQDCVEVSKEFFDCTILIQPDGVIMDGDNPEKGRGSRVLQECMNFSMRGVLETFFPVSQFFTVFGNNPIEKHNFLMENLEIFLKKEVL